MTTVCVHSKGYLLEYKPDHPYANHAGYVPLHRIIYERKLDRSIDPSIEDVHHMDGNVTNNDLANLTLLTKKEHRRIHAGWEIVGGEWWKTCPGCARFIPVKNNFYIRKTQHNEYVSECKLCTLQKSKYNSKRYTNLKERTCICVVCGKEFKTSRFSHAVHCSTLCTWVTRKAGK